MQAEQNITKSPYLTVKEIAAHLRLSPRTIYSMVSDNKMPFRRAGDTLLFHRDEIDQWTREGAKQKLHVVR
jgi:excisionase family DNA binding protein